MFNAGQTLEPAPATLGLVTAIRAMFVIVSSVAMTMFRSVSILLRLIRLVRFRLSFLPFTPHTLAPKPIYLSQLLASFRSGESEIDIGNGQFLAWVDGPSCNE